MFSFCYQISKSISGCPPRATKCSLNVRCMVCSASRPVQDSEQASTPKPQTLTEERCRWQGPPSGFPATLHGAPIN
jgi:hypothetical protein